MGEEGGRMGHDGEEDWVRKEKQNPNFHISLPFYTAYMVFHLIK